MSITGVFLCTLPSKLIWRWLDDQWVACINLPKKMSNCCIISSFLQWASKWESYNFWKDRTNRINLKHYLKQNSPRGEFTIQHPCAEGPRGSGEKQQEVLAQNLTEIKLPAVTETEIAWVKSKTRKEKKKEIGGHTHTHTHTPLLHIQLSQQAPWCTFTVQRSKQAAMLFPGNKCLTSWHGVNTDIMPTGSRGTGLWS